MADTVEIRMTIPKKLADMKSELDKTWLELLLVGVKARWNAEGGKKRACAGWKCLEYAYKGFFCTSCRKKIKAVNHKYKR